MYIAGRKVILREIEESDLETLWTWRNASRFTRFCSVRRNSIEFEEFIEEMDSDFSIDRHEQFLIYKSSDSNQAIGTIFSYKFNPDDGHAFVTIYVADEYAGKGYGTEAAALFFQYLFERFSLHKIYLEVYEYNRLSLEPLIKAGATIEGKFLEHRLYDGRRWDLIRLAIYNKQLNRIRSLTRLDKIELSY